MRRRFFLCIFLGLSVLGSSISFGLADEVPSVPAKKGFLVRSRIRRNSSRMVETGVRLVYWQPVLKAAFLRRLKREPTPAEYEFQQEQINHLVSRLVKHVEIDSDGNWNPLPSEVGDHKLVRISGFDVINLEKIRFEIPEAWKGRFLCSEGYCFVPDIFSLRSELVMDTKSYVFLGRRERSPRKKKKSSVECPRFREHDRGPMVVNLPVPKVRQEKIRMLYANILRGVVTIHSRSLTQFQFEEMTPPPKQTSP